MKSARRPSWRAFLNLKTPPIGACRRELAKRVVEDRWRNHDGEVVLRVTGRSMGASLPAGTRVRLAMSFNGQLRRGDIVCIRRGQKRVVHRLVAVLGPVCVEKGDANRFPRLCWRSAIVGKVIDTSLSGDAQC